MAAVKVVLPWSTCPIVPMFTCGLFRSNFSLLIVLFSASNYRNCFLEPAMRFELMTSSLPRRRSTPELRGLTQRYLPDCAPVQVSKTQTNSLHYVLERATT